MKNLIKFLNEKAEKIIATMFLLIVSVGLLSMSIRVFGVMVQPEKALFSDGFILFVSLSVMICSWASFLYAFVPNINKKETPFYYKLGLVLLMTSIFLSSMYYSFGYAFSKVLYLAFLFAYLSHIAIIILFYLWQAFVWIYNKIKWWE